MGRIARTCLQIFLKAMNLVMGMVGMAMIIYAFWMFRVWLRDMQDSSSPDDFNPTSPWFIYTFLGFGVTFCIITCMGHIAADCANGFCLSCYVVIIGLLLLLEAAIAADILLNSDWEKDLPEDATGRLHDFLDFIKSNFDIFRWIGILVILSQGCAAILAMTLRAVNRNRGSSYDSDEEYVLPPARVPLINHQLPPSAPVIGDPYIAAKNHAWNMKK